MASRRSILLTIVLLLAMASGCRDTDESSLARMSNGALSEQAYLCRNATGEMSPGRAVASGNVDRECKDRSADEGYHVC